MKREYGLVIPMAGLGSRFSNAGYQTPKPLLPVGDYRMFEIVIANFANEGLSEISIVAPSQFKLDGDIAALSGKLQIPIQLKSIDHVTSGPAESAALGVEMLKSDLPVIVANSDQFLNFESSAWVESVLESGLAGSILCMRDDDPKWSYARCGDSGFVEEVAEKRVISELATCGVYFFESSSTFKLAYDEMVDADLRVNGEFYVAPMYNQLVGQGFRVSAFDLGPVSEVMFGLGIPEDYESFVSSSLVQTTNQLCERVYSG